MPHGCRNIISLCTEIQKYWTAKSQQHNSICSEHTCFQTPEALPPLIFLPRGLCLEYLLCSLPSIMLISRSSRLYSAAEIRASDATCVSWDFWDAGVNPVEKAQDSLPSQPGSPRQDRPLRAYKMSFSSTSMHLHCPLIHLMGYYLGSDPVHKASVKNSYFSKKDIQVCFKGVYEDWDDTERFCS